MDFCPSISQESADIVVVNNAWTISETQETNTTSAEASSTPAVKEKFVNKAAPAGGFLMVHIAFVVLIVLVLSLFLAVVASTIAFSVELSNLKADDGSAEQQQSIGALASRLDNLNSSMDGLFQQLLQDLGSREQQINSSLDMLFQRLSQDGSPIDSRQLNSTLETIFEQHLQDRQDILAVHSMTQQVNFSVNMLSQHLLQDISEANNNIELVNNTLLQQVSDVLTLVLETIAGLRALGELETFPASSCAGLLPSLSSGYYFVRASNGSAVRVYCDMTLSCGGVTGGWMRVAEQNFNISRNDSCPTGFTERFDNMDLLRTCVVGTTGCTTFDIYPTYGVTYSSVCGKFVGYQLGTPEAFARSIVISSLTVDSQYLDGLSLTHGSSPRQHIWSLPVGVTESRTDRFGCPCNVGNTITAPSFIGVDYFCDSAASGIASGMAYPDNPLWDGVGCAASSECCTFNNPPWFYRELPQPTSDDVELRSCQDEGVTTEGVPIESIEIYVR